MPVLYSHARMAYDNAMWLAQVHKCNVTFKEGQPVFTQVGRLDKVTIKGRLVE